MASWSAARRRWRSAAAAHAWPRRSRAPCVRARRRRRAGRARAPRTRAPLACSRPRPGAPPRRACARRPAPGRRRPRRGWERAPRAGSAGSARLARRASRRAGRTGPGSGHRHGRAVEQVEQRQVHARHRLPEPLLAERPGAETLHVRHVRVQHEAERPGACRGALTPAPGSASAPPSAAPADRGGSRTPRPGWREAERHRAWRWCLNHRGGPTRKPFPAPPKDQRKIRPLQGRSTATKSSARQSGGRSGSRERRWRA